MKKRYKRTLGGGNPEIEKKIQEEKKLLEKLMEAHMKAQKQHAATHVTYPSTTSQWTQMVQTVPWAAGSLTPLWGPWSTSLNVTVERRRIAEVCETILSFMDKNNGHLAECAEKGDCLCPRIHKLLLADLREMAKPEEEGDL